MLALTLVVATLTAPAPLSAYGGRVVWSEQLGPRSYALVALAHGERSRLPIAPRKVPFDVDLGPTADGHVAAVYTRCTKEVEGPSGYGPPVFYERGRGCDIWEFDFAEGHERRLDEASSPTANEAWPTLWRSRIAFERAYDGRRAFPYLYVHDLGSRVASRRLAAGPHHGRAHATGLDLRRRTLAYAWTFAGSQEGLATQLRLDGLGGASRVVDSERGGGLTQVMVGWPSIEGGWVYWSRACFGDESGCPRRYSLRRRRLAGGRIQNAKAPPFAVAHTRGDGRTYVERSHSGTGMCGEPGGDFDPCPLLQLEPAYG